MIIKIDIEDGIDRFDAIREAGWFIDLCQGAIDRRGATNPICEVSLNGYKVCAHKSRAGNIFIDVRRVK